MADWVELPLGELITLQRGFDLPSQDRKPGNVPIVSSSGISDYHSEVGVKGPGVITGRYGTIGQVFLIKEDYWPLNTTLWVKNFHGNDPQFASYHRDAHGRKAEPTCGRGVGQAERFHRDRRSR